MDTESMKAREITAKVSHAAINAERLSLNELEMALSQALDFIESLPPEKRGAFYWNCGGLECLSMVVSALKKSSSLADH